MRILVVPNVANAASVHTAGRVVAWLLERGATPVLVHEDAQACGLPTFGIARAEVGEPALVVALGGDGTILKAVHLLDGTRTPVLGINLGRLGFLTGAEDDELESALAAALAGDVRIERRQMLQADVEVGGRFAGRYRALNEVFVGRGASARVVELDVAVNGIVLWRFVCDGLIVATPTGSTAYAMSAGGPIVSPDVRAMLIVPVAAHTLKARPVVVGPSDVIEIRCPNPRRADVCVSVDGDQVPCRRSLDRVRIRIADDEVQLVKVDGTGFLEVLADKILGV